MGQQRPVTERNVGNIKGVIGRRKSKKDTKYIYRKKKKGQTMIYTDRATRTPLKTGDELGCSRMVAHQAK
jgi:hypothetical protein